MIPNSANPTYLIVTKMNKCIEESNGNKYLKLIHSDESKDTLKKCVKSCREKPKILSDQQIKI